MIPWTFFNYSGTVILNEVLAIVAHKMSTKRVVMSEIVIKDKL